MAVDCSYLGVMLIVGHGIDLVETSRMAGMLSRHEGRMLARVFTPGEQAYCEANVKRRVEHYAARFAAKEAALKALGTGWSGGIAWTDVSVVREASGRPRLEVVGVAAEVALDLGVRRWWVSLSHVEGMAMASVIAQGGDG